jgi:hypothetical protein
MSIVQGQLGQKVSEPYLKNQPTNQPTKTSCWALLIMRIILAMLEVVVGGSHSKVNPGKGESLRHYLKNQLKQIL